jgi:hypothetical protein
VDITRDVMRMLQEGKELKEIRAIIDAEYSQYGPPTDTDPIGAAHDANCDADTAACGNASGAAANSALSPQPAGPTSTNN